METHLEEEKRNKYSYFEIRVTGKLAMYTDPVTRLSSEKISYPIPVYSALKGILESVYFDPVIQWVIDDCRIMNQIKWESVWFLDPYRKDRVLQNYLSDCEYQVRAHMIPNYDIYKAEDIRNIRLCIESARKALRVGGRRYAYLGTKKCPAYVDNIKFGEGNGYYNNTGLQRYELMFHSFEYPEHNKQNVFKARFWRPVMNDGVIHFGKPYKFDYVRVLHNLNPYIPPPIRYGGNHGTSIII